MYAALCFLLAFVCLSCCGLSQIFTLLSQFDEETDLLDRIYEEITAELMTEGQKLLLCEDSEKKDRLLTSLSLPSPQTTERQMIAQTEAERGARVLVCVSAVCVLCVDPLTVSSV